MALRNQPYLPLYVDDFLTDERLNECTAESTGVYIKLMCLMHKQEYYGVICLKQKDKQSEEQIFNFANKLARVLPFRLDEITRSLNELLSENVLFIDGDMLVQKRMVKDNDISEKRASAGKNGGKSTQSKGVGIHEKKGNKENILPDNLLKAKLQANTVNVIVNESVINIGYKEAFLNFKKMRVKTKKPMTERAEQMIHAKLEAMAPGDDGLKGLILDQSTLNNWQDIYKLKQDRNLTQTSKVENVINIATAATYKEQQEA